MGVEERMNKKDFFNKLRLKLKQDEKEIDIDNIGSACFRFDNSGANASYSYNPYEKFPIKQRNKISARQLLISSVVFSTISIILSILYFIDVLFFVERISFFSILNFIIFSWIFIHSIENLIYEWRKK